MKGQDQNLAYVYSSYSGANCCFQSEIDSRLTNISKVAPSFSTFLETDVPGEERILVCIENQFFIFKPNGQIVQEVEFVDPELEGKAGQEFRVREVSSNMVYFVFEELDVVYQLMAPPKKAKYQFERTTEFNLVPQEDDIEVDPKSGRTFKSKKKLEKYRKANSAQAVFPVSGETPRSKRSNTTQI